MSWLSTLERDYKYTCVACGKTLVNRSAEGYPACKDSRLCECGGEATYNGFLPTKINIRGKVSYEQNGRKAYMVTDGKGNVRYVSATKEHYCETGDIKPQYTRAYEQHLKKVGQEEQLEETKYDKLVADRQHAVARMKEVKEARESMLKEDSNEI